MYVTKSKVLVTKARITKAIALVETGYINEGYQVYRRVVDQKDLPKFGIKDSEVNRRADGSNFFFDRDTIVYYNDLSPEHEKNQPTIEYLLKPVEPTSVADLKKYCSPTVLEMLMYLRSLFLVRLGESENAQGSEREGLRARML